MIWHQQFGRGYLSRKQLSSFVIQVQSNFGPLFNSAETNIKQPEISMPG
jgi:hypothetical protein